MESQLPKTKEELEEQMVDDAFQHLKDTYLASRHRKKIDIINKAFNFARQAHKGVKRLSGEPYILHPIAVAQIACEEMGLGSTSISAALLHDVVEDTDYTVEDIENIFGAKIAQIVDGLTKISGGIFGDHASAQAENFKKLLLTMSDDIRVILIKICDRLHNMRTLESQPANKQYKIAGETLYIYAPLANRLGLNKIKTELENLSFKFEHPEEYANITNKLNFTKEERDKLFEEFTAPIRQALDAAGVKYKIIARVKSPYSIWNKMQTKHVTFEEIYDLLAVRIIFTPKVREEEINECFKIYVAISRIYKSHPDRLRDWLNHPKANGYQALHVTLMCKQGRWIEVQIRSDRMDDCAEQGFAAHWKYKDKNAPYDENELDHWLNSIKEILDDPQPDTLDLLDTIKLNLYSNEIMVFTPKGELKKMPPGSTALDFAFSIHSFVGSHCFGAKVNHQLVPLNYRLKSGDQVEVITSQKQHVSPTWLNFVTSAKARNKIQALLRRDRREKARAGDEAMRAFLTKNDIEPTPVVLDKLLAGHGLKNREELFVAVAEGRIVPGDDDIAFIRNKKSQGSWWRHYIPFIGRGKTAAATVTGAKDTADFVRNINRKQTLRLDEETLSHCVMADCCRPIPGDDVLGYITQQGTLEIHQRSCAEAMKHKTRYGNDIIACQWDTHRLIPFDCRLSITGVDQQGVLYAIADVLHKQENCPIRRITIETRDGIFQGYMDLAVYDTEDVRRICRLLSQIESVSQAVRVEMGQEHSRPDMPAATDGAQ